MGTSTRRTAVAGFALLAVLAASSCGGRAPASQRTAEESPPATTLSAPDGDPTTTPAAPPDTLPDGGYVSAITADVVDNPAFDGFEADVTQLIGQAGLPGASLLVVQHGELVEQEAWMDYTLDTQVPIASASKWLSAATIMTLVDDGTFALDEPISTYVPQLVGPNVREITMRQLLSFTSGLVAEARVPCSDDPSFTLQECAALILKAGVVHPPGEVFRYGSQHLMVAGAIAELVTGVPFAELFQQRIARPLGMADTAFVETAGAQVEVVDFPNPAGTAVSTLGDYGRFLEMISHEGLAPDGTRLLQAATVAEMQSNQIEDASYGAAAEFRVKTEAPYGLGEWVDWTRADGSSLVVSSDGKFGFRPWIDKENDLYGVYLVNDRGAGYVEGDPDSVDDGTKVHTSGLWIFTWVAEALGGSLPTVQYPHRG